MIARNDLPGVLLVDDRPENLLALEAVLAPLPCRLVSVTSGQEALRRLLHEEFALILLDVQMPELDGFETAEYIKRREKTRAVPIIFVTAISKERHHVFRGYETGAVDYVFKPYDPQLLRAKVQVFLELHGATRAVRRSEELLRATFDAAPIGMARLDDGGTIQQVNRSLCQVLGMREGVLLGRTLASLTHPDDVALDADLRRDLLIGRKSSYEVEARLVDAEGGEVPAQLSFSTARDEDGRLRALLVQVQDIRERRRAEKAREELIREQAARAEAEAFARRQDAIRTITDAALAPLALKDLLRELLARITDILSVDGAAVMLGEGDDGQVVVQAAGEAATYVEQQGDVDSPLTARIMEERRPIVIEDSSREPGLSDHALGRAVTSLVGVPLMVEGRAIGSLQVGTLFTRRFTEDDIDLLQLAADRAALAIERVRFIERQHTIAEDLQRSLLPESLPPIPGLAMAARYFAGGAGTRVGGDWYDAIPLPGGRVALVIGDVAGRGIAAAAMMGQLRSALRAYALDGAEPAQVLDRLNRFLLSLSWDSMATALVLLLEPASGHVTYANAGHPPPMVLGADGVARSLKESLSVPLGALDVPGYTQASCKLEPGASLVVYTDGLVEQRDELIDRGIERLETALVSRGPGEPEALCERILSGTIGGSDGPPDDVTLLVVQAATVLEERMAMELIGEPAALSAFRQSLRRWLLEGGADDEEIQDVTMATNEACQNAIEHAYGLAPEPFDVELARENGGVKIAVRDRGGWRDGSSEDRGRGLPLMRALMDAVDIEQRPTGSTVTLRREIGKGRAEAPKPKERRRRERRSGAGR